MKITRLDSEKTWQEQPGIVKAAPGRKTCIIVRYGAFGDMMQMSSILPGLKEQGFYIILNTSDTGLKMMRHDPHVDEVLLQKVDQVPNSELGQYWKSLYESCDKFVNLSESVEGALIALPQHRSWNWTKEFRDSVMGMTDYVAGQHMMAGVLGPARVRFYPSKEERLAALKFRRSIKAKKVIVWALSGSSGHKCWPFTDRAIARLMLEDKGTTVVLVGDEMCQMLEVGWEKEPRVICKSGKWSIRETLAFAQVADMVIGPETGVLNAVAHEPMRKVILLSHSSPENIGKSWRNTVVITPKDVDCYPCHKLHYGWSTCIRDTTTGAALCAANIPVSEVVSAIRSAAHDVPRTLQTA